MINIRGAGPGNEAGSTPPRSPIARIGAALRGEGMHTRGLSSPLVTAGAIAAILASVIFFWSWRSGLDAGASNPTWFAGYVDVTVSPPYAFEQASTPSTKDVVLAFIVASPDRPCAASWGTGYSLDEAGRVLGLDKRIAALRSKGGSASVSFGGALNTELASSCQDESQLRVAYRDVVERYDPAFIEFDLEDANLLDEAAGQRRAKAIAALQGDRGTSGKKLGVWMTLPVTPRGLTDPGITAINQMLEAGVDLAGVNIMTMNYGASRSGSQTMSDAATAAADATHDQLGILYQRAGINLSSEQAWKKLGVTPMIGRNDLPGEFFDQDAARNLKDYALNRGIQRLSMWSLNRDVPCAPGANSDAASHICSGLDQGNTRFSELLGGALPGRMG
ncbi:chitinase [Arthrobacter sp. 92]|jgi:chitinase|uniref:chitinase n=1 Tax=Arthrobacter sp. 92 TaxID=3418175 RepID=UPI0006A90E80|nr:probable bifunctional chitinase/lysozyme [Arthrobacter sp. Hiyo6]